jgi:hypothetical protein
MLARGVANLFCILCIPPFRKCHFGTDANVHDIRRTCPHSSPRCGRVITVGTEPYNLLHGSRALGGIMVWHTAPPKPGDGKNYRLRPSLHTNIQGHVSAPSTVQVAMHAPLAQYTKLQSLRLVERSIFKILPRSNSHAPHTANPISSLHAACRCPNLQDYLPTCPRVPATCHPQMLSIILAQQQNTRKPTGGTASRTR